MNDQFGFELVLGGACWQLRQLGLLNVPRAQYDADPSGAADRTEALQHEVNDTRDRALVCLCTEGTCLISFSHVFKGIDIGIRGHAGAPRRSLS